jgi:hypothetical protein
MLAKLIAAIFLFALTASCSVPDMNSDYAVETVRLPNGQNIYFKREIRGITGNYNVISVSANNDPCASCDHKTDYCLKAMWPEVVYYQLDGETLHLFAYGGLTTPEKFPLTIKIETHDITGIPAEDEFERMMARKGALRLTLTATNKCR